MSVFPGKLDTITDGSTSIIAAHVKNLQKILVGPTMVNLQGEGADMSGAVACDSIFTAAKAKLPTGGGILYAPQGILSTTAGLVVPSGVSFIGEGGGHAFPEVRNAPVTQINYTGASNAAAIVLSTDTTKPYIGTISGFQVQAEYLAGIAFKILEAGGALFMDINCMNSTADCVLLQPTGALGGHLYLCTFDRVMGHDCNGNAWRINGFSAGAGAITLNTFLNCRYSANGGTPVSLNYQQFADTNVHVGGRVEANVATMTGAIFNSQAPTVDSQVYSNRFLGVTFDGTSLAAQTAVIQNENTQFINLMLGTSFGGGWTTTLSLPHTSASTAGGSGIYVDMSSGYTPVKRSVTAGASVYTYKNQDGYQEVFMLTTVGGLTAMSYKGQAGASIVIGVPFVLNPGDTMALTWITTAPVFEIIPMPVT